ncbi:MAG: Hsp20/alpha crystallin family protein [Pseudomonadota bacterium]
MDVIKWRPFKDLETLRGDMDTLWDRFFGERVPVIRKDMEWIPPIDISETKDAVVVTTEMPGIDPNDVNISFVQDMLTIKGEKKQEKEEEGESYYRVERGYGSFSRSFRIPVPINEKEIKAQNRGGILKITLPKAEKVKPKEIKITVE